MTTGKTKIASNIDDFFKPQSIVSESDIEDLTRFNDAIKDGTPYLTALKEQMGNSSEAARNLAKSAKGAAVDINAIPKATKAATIGMKVLSVAGNMLASALISLAITAIVKGIDYLIHRTEKLQEALQKSTEEFNATTEELKSLEDELKATTKRLDELQKLADNGTISIAEESELETLKKTNKELSRKIALKQQEQAQNARDVLKDSKKNATTKVDSEYKEQTTSSGNYTYKVDVLPAEELEMAIDAYNVAEKALNNPNLNKNSEWIYKENRDKASNRIEEMYALISPVVDAYEDLINAGIELEGEDKTRYEQLKKTQDAYLLYIYTLNGTREAFKGLNAEQQRNILLNRLVEQGLSENVAKAVVGSISDEDLSDFWDKSFSFVPPEMKDGETAEQYGKRYAEAWLKGLQDGIENTDKVTYSLEDFNKEMDKVQEGYDAVQSAIDEYNEKGYLSVDTTQKLLEVDDKLLATLVDENGKVNLNTLGFEALARAKLENLKASATETLTTWISKLEEEGTTADELAAKYVKVAAAKDLANGEVQTGYTDRDGNWVDITETSEYKAYLAKIKAIENAIAGIGKGGLGSGKGSGGSKNEALDNYLKDAENRYKIHQDETKYIQELEYAYDNLTKKEEERLDITGKINEAYRDLADNRIKDVEHQIDLQKELYGDDVDVTGYYDQIQVVAQEEANRLRAMGYDDSSNEVQAMQKAWWDAQNSKLDFYSKQHENIIRDIEYARDMALSANPFTDTTSYYKQLQNEYHNEAERLRALDPEKYKDEIENLSQAWWSAQKSIVDGSYSNSERWISERNAYNDWELYGDNEVDAWGRVLERFKTEFPNELEKIKEIEQKIFEARKNAMEKSISDIDDYIDARNHYNDWDAYGDSEIKAIQRQTKIIEDAYEQRLLSYEEYVKKIEENNQRLYSVAKNSVIETISNLIEDYEEKIQNKTDALGLKSSQYDSLKTLLQSYYDVTNAVAEAQHEINKELKASQSMYEYLNEETRDLLFNQEDYEVLNEKLIDIQSSANALQEQYNKDILNATKETIDEITSQYQMQYETMMKQYEVAKAELDVAKKRQKLDNVLAERNVRMFINGQWQWVANTQNVIDAQNELAEAEIQREQTEASLEQVDSINKLTSAQDDITTQINYLETDLEKVRNKWADMQKMLSGESNAVAKVLKEISTVSSPELKKVIEETGGSISAFSASLSEAIYTLLNGGSSPKAPSFSQNYNATATLPNGTTVGVNINNKGKTTTPDLPKGTVVHTAGGDFEIIGGSGGNYDSKPVSSSSSGGGSSSSSSSGKTVQVGSDGNAPKGTNVGDVVKTAGGDYLVVPPNTEGASYNSASGLWSVKIDEKDADGTRYTSGGVTLMGEDGFEAFISNNGRLIPIDRPTIGNVGAGGIVFNREQMANLRNLWDWSNIGKVSSYASSSNSNSQSTVIDNSIHINGLTISEQGNEDWINGLRRYVATHK